MQWVLAKQTQHLIKRKVKRCSFPYALTQRRMGILFNVQKTALQEKKHGRKETSIRTSMETNYSDVIAHIFVGKGKKCSLSAR